jgi:hypothetical protein
MSVSPWFANFVEKVPKDSSWLERDKHPLTTPASKNTAPYDTQLAGIVELGELDSLD